MLTIQGKFANDTPQDATFRYELTTTKQEKSGSFEALAGEEISLSNTSVYQCH